MIVALYGPTASGKTSVGRVLAGQLNFPIRSCGEEIKQRAKTLGLSVDALPGNEHRVIDQLTLDWVREHPNGVVEGRFLNYVLAGVLPPPIFVSLTASLDAREARYRTKGANPDAVRQSDASDIAFIKDVYGDIISESHKIILDNSYEPVIDCSNSLVRFLKTLQP